MIVWLASYPRSGNTLLRQVLHYAFERETWHEGDGWPDLPSDDRARLIASPEEFYAHASATPEPVLVKTHLPPPDGQPAVYVVRDGRSAISSFLRYERRVSPESESNSLLQLILGDHHYGGWSEHYRRWHEREGAQILTLRYEQLFRVDEHAIRQLAEFIGHDGAVNPWQNDIQGWRRQNPEFVGEARVSWRPEAEWDSVCDAVFWRLHGDLMRELGLDDLQRVPPPPDGAGAAVERLTPLLERFLAQRRELQAAADEKERVIAELARAAEERLAVIEELTSAAQASVAQASV